MGVGTDPESTSDAQLGLKAALSSACEFSAQHLGSGALAWADRGRTWAGWCLVELPPRSGAEQGLSIPHA